MHWPFWVKFSSERFWLSIKLPEIHDMVTLLSIAKIKKFQKQNIKMMCLPTSLIASFSWLSANPADASNSLYCFWSSDSLVSDIDKLVSSCLFSWCNCVQEFWAFWRSFACCASMQFNWSSFSCNFLLSTSLVVSISFICPTFSSTAVTKFPLVSEICRTNVVQIVANLNHLFSLWSTELDNEHNNAAPLTKTSAYCIIKDQIIFQLNNFYGHTLILIPSQAVSNTSPFRKILKQQENENATTECSKAKSIENGNFKKKPR